MAWPVHAAEFEVNMVTLEGENIQHTLLKWEPTFPMSEQYPVGFISNSASIACLRFIAHPDTQSLTES